MSSEHQSTPGKITIAGISQSDLLVNTYQLKALAAQIRGNDSCYALQQVIDQAMQSVTALIAGIIKTQLDILADFFPILKLPSANPFAIVKWISKLVFGTAVTQYLAYIQYAIQLIQLAGALADLIAAVEAASEELANCNITLDPSAIFKEQLATVNTALTDALGQVDEQAAAIQRVVGDAIKLTTFDTSDPIKFIQSVDSGLAQFKEDAAVFTNISVIPDTLPSAGQSFKSNADGSVFWGDPVSNTVSFTSSGTFTVPENVTKLKVTVVGAGGGGYGSTNKNYGGSGGLTTGTITVTPGQVITATVGTGGADTGLDGSDSSFDSLVATGGKGASSGGSGDGDNGTGSGGSLNLTGIHGESTHMLKGKGGYGQNSGGKDGLIVIEH